jgi:hypothetical protein
MYASHYIHTDKFQIMHMSHKSYMILYVCTYQYHICTAHIDIYEHMYDTGTCTYMYAVPTYDTAGTNRYFLVPAAGDSEIV